MYLRKFFIFVFFCFCSQAWAGTNVASIPTHFPPELLTLLTSNTHKHHPKSADSKHHTQKISRVIYVTLDGVRWQDVFLNRKYFKIFWRKQVKNMKVYGEPQTPTTMEVASVPTSLPSYQSQMSGEIQPCQDNHCGRLNVETFPEKLIHQFGLNKKNVAVFSSWYEINYADEHQLGTIFDNSGNKPVYNPDTSVADIPMRILNLAQNKLSPDRLNRFDIFTFAQAMHYLDVYQPRFLWLSLTDADNAAHMGSKFLYHRVLDLYDLMLDILFAKLDALGLSDETMVIITTDHGRGNGKHWTDHGPEYPESKQTWAFTKNGMLLARDSLQHYSTLSIRPTIESIFKTG